MAMANKSEDANPRKRSSRSGKETATERLRGIFALDALSVSVVSAFAGDRPPTEAEEIFLSNLKDARGKLFFSDILYTITHHYFPPVTAEKLWNEILQHKCIMSKALNRNVQITVATLDYLSNVKSEIFSQTLISEDYIAEIAESSMRDGLTGLFNHTSFFELIDMELKLYERYETVVSLLIMDIDDFKDINDFYGHQEGDRILIELAAIIKGQTRASDICCRYGGEEFAVILPFTDARVAGEIAEKLRTALMRNLPNGQHLTVSLGVASCDENTTSPYALMKRADDALYQAKKNGKNQVVIKT